VSLQPPLVSSEWLASQLDNPDIVVLDCRWYLKPFDQRDGRTEYERSHLPGARYVSWADDLADPTHGALNMLAPAERFAEAMEALGVGDDTVVVTYDDHHVPVAARVWWSLRVYGHTQVAVLDGGYTAWAAEGRPLESGPSTQTRSDRPTFTPRFDRSLYATKKDVLDAVQSGRARLVDARMDVAYQAASGHIPGSERMTGLGFLADGEHWHSPAASRKRIEDAQLADNLETILYCGGGVAATGALLGWTLAGLGDNVRVYDGSWGEWEQDPDTPKEHH
jgi:thiosulfate/3-mercaptopyruvate sulfurtransferase